MGLPLAIGLVLAPTGAGAQRQSHAVTDSHIPAKPEAVDPRQAGSFRKGFARCVYRRFTDKVALYLSNSDPISVDYTKAHVSADRIVRDLGMDDCLGEQMEVMQLAMSLRMVNKNLRPMLQEEDYLEHYKQAPSLPPESAEFIERSYVSSGDDLALAKGFGAFADCVAFRDTAHADAILRTLPGSPEEAAAARSLAPTLGACLIEGQTLSLTPTNVRAFAADGLWTRYMRQAAGATSGKGEAG